MTLEFISNTCDASFDCRNLATLRANVSVKELDTDNRKTALGTTKDPLHCAKISRILVH